MIVERLDPFTTEDHGNKTLHLERYEWAAKRIEGEDVLDIACGLGYGSAILADANPGAHVLGADRAQDAITVARERHGSERVAFEVINDAEKAAFGERRFDTIVSLETLEHLRHPIAFLKRMHALLAPGGRLIVSAPVRENPGDNPYHFHCFRPDTLRALVSEGFTIEEELDQIGHYLTVVARKREEPVLAWRRSEEDADPRVTIVLVTWNALENVIELVSSIRRFTKTPYELYVVDNASTDGTREYVSLYVGEPGFKIVRNPRNEECAKATNLAIATSRTEYILYLCASHTLVSGEGWEAPLLKFLDERPAVEIAGDVWNPGFVLPSRNYAPGWTPEGHGVESLRHVQGGAWIARRILFSENGYFDQERYPHGGMDVEFSYRLLSYNKPLGHCPAISCPQTLDGPVRTEGVTVFHAPPDELRAGLRRALGLSPRAPAQVIELKNLERFTRGRGRIAVEGGSVLVRAVGPLGALETKEAFTDVRVKGRLLVRDHALVRLRTSESERGFEIFFGPGGDFIGREGRVLGRFKLERPEFHFALEARGSTVMLSLDGRRVLDVIDEQAPSEGHVLFGALQGDAVFTGVTIERLNS